MTSCVVCLLVHLHNYNQDKPEAFLSHLSADFSTVLTKVSGGSLHESYLSMQG